MWTSVDHAPVLHTSSAREVCLFSSRGVPRSTDVRVFVSVIFTRFVANLAIVQFLCGLTHHVLELHGLDAICVPCSGFLVHVTHVLVLPLDVLQLKLAFVSTRP